MAVFPIFSHQIHLQGFEEWPTVEHYYRRKICGNGRCCSHTSNYAAQTPADAAAGRAQTRQVRLDWEQVKTQVMREAVLKSF